MALEDEIVEYQKMEKELQAVLLQRYQVEAQLNEITLALEAIEKIGEGDEVYRAVGSILIKSSKEKAEKDLNERKELLEARLKSLTQQEEKLRSALARISKKLQESLKHGAQ